LRASAAKDKNNAEAMETVGESFPLGVALESESASQDDAAFVSSMGQMLRQNLHPATRGLISVKLRHETSSSGFQTNGNKNTKSPSNPYTG